jgi:hypothetical protein
MGRSVLRSKLRLCNGTTTTVLHSRFGLRLQELANALPEQAITDTVIALNDRGPLGDAMRVLVTLLQQYLWSP